MEPAAVDKAEEGVAVKVPVHPVAVPVKEAGVGQEAKVISLEAVSAVPPV